MDPLRILHLEDSSLDAELVQAHLEEAGLDCSITRAASQAEYVTALENHTFDLVLADYSLPQFDGLRALAILKNRGDDTPFILLSGALGEDVAIESLKSGATDYVLKQRLERLEPAVRRALREVAERSQRCEAEAALRKREQEFRTLVEHSPDVIARMDNNFRYTYISPRSIEFLHKPPEEILGKTDRELGMPPEAASAWEAALRQVFTTRQAARFEHANAMESIIAPEFDSDGAVETALVVNRDIRERRKAEEALRESEERTRAIMDSLLAFVGLITPEGILIEANRTSLEAAGLKPQDVLNKPFTETYWWSYSSEVQKQLRDAIARAAQGEIVRYDVPVRVQGGRLVTIDFIIVPLWDTKGKLIGLIPSGIDITERKRQQTDIEDLNKRLRDAMEESHHRIKNNLQVLASIISIQTMEERETVPRASLLRLNQHIHALADLHDLLTQKAREEGLVDNISLQKTLERLLPLLETVAGRHCITAKVEDVLLPIRQAGSFTMLVNELVSNAIKYGHNEVHITLTRSGKEACLEVGDDGEGFPSDFDPHKAANTGLELAETLSRWDLQGEIRYGNRPPKGACVTVTFPVPEITSYPM